MRTRLLKLLASLALAGLSQGALAASSSIPLPEHPRPDFQRANITLLSSNGGKILKFRQAARTEAA